MQKAGTSDHRAAIQYIRKDDSIKAEDDVIRDNRPKNNKTQQNMFSTEGTKLCG